MHAVQHHRRIVIPSAVSLPKLPPLSESWKLFSGLSVSHGPLSDEDDDVALLSVEMEPGEIIIFPTLSESCGGRMGKGMSLGCKTVLCRHH